MKALSRLLPLMLVLILTAPAWAQESGKAVVIASKNFPENRILAEIMAQLIERRTDIPVVRRNNLGATRVIYSALRSGKIDLYPEYTGTGWSIHLKIKDKIQDPLRAYTHVAEQFRKRFGIAWLQPFGFSNTYVLGVSEAFAKRHKLSTISDLRTIKDTVRAGFSHEFKNRADGYKGLSQHYQFKIKELKAMEHGLAYAAIEANEIDVIDAMSTDGKLLKYQMRLLKDDKSFFPPYHCAPVVRMDTLKRHPRLRDLLNELAYRIDEQTMSQLNYQVEERHRSYEDVARQFLSDTGLIKAGQASNLTHSGRRGLLQVFWSRRHKTLKRALDHMLLTVAAMLLAIAVAVPLAIVLTRNSQWSFLVLGSAGVVQTIPSLALLAFLIPLPGLGLGPRSAIVALFIYALLPILRNTYTGIRDVDPELCEAALGMGLTNMQILSKIELPLATRAIMAGIRTATTISIGIATLAAFIGAGGLGDPIVTGLQLNDTGLILSGAVPAALLALVVDGLLGLVENALAPKGLELLSSEPSA